MNRIVYLFIVILFLNSCTDISHSIQANEYMKDLKSDEHQKKLSAVIGLKILMIPTVIPSLVELVKRDSLIDNYNLISDPNKFALRYAVDDAIIVLGKKNFIPLTNILKNKREIPDIRVYVIYILGKINNPKIIPDLINLIKKKKEDINLKMNAIEILGRFENKKAMKFLYKFLKINKSPTKKEYSIRIEAINSLKRNNSDKAEKMLIKALMYKNTLIKIGIIKALAEKKSKPAIEPLIDIIKNDGHRVIVAEAFFALEKITRENFGMDKEKLLKWWEENKGAKF